MKFSLHEHCFADCLLVLRKVYLYCYDGLRVVEFHLVAEVLDVVGIDVVQSGRSLGIAFGIDVGAEFVNLFLRDDIPSRTVVLDVGVYGAQESGGLEEVEEVDLCGVAETAHEVELLLSVVGGPLRYEGSRQGFGGRSVGHLG